MFTKKNKNDFHCFNIQLVHDMHMHFARLHVYIQDVKIIIPSAIWKMCELFKAWKMIASEFEM